MNKRRSFHIDDDHVVITVEVAVPWRDESVYYRHAIDSRGINKEFAPLPAPIDPFNAYERQRLLEARAKSIDVLAALIARSLLHALSDEL